MKNYFTRVKYHYGKVKMAEPINANLNVNNYCITKKCM